MESILDFEEALAIVLREGARAWPRPLESVALHAAPGRVLATGIRADRDQPAFDRSTRDGFAVRASDWGAALPLQIVGQVRAGDAWRGAPLGVGQAIQIMTGAPIPPGADAVAMVEHVAPTASGIRPVPGRTLQAGGNIVRRGSEARGGDQVLEAGTRLGAAEIALAAACGMAQVDVFARPRVAIAATGDELLEVGSADELRPEQIRNSNSYAIAALVEAAGGEADKLAIARDRDGEIRDRIERGRAADLLVFSGGVSMGEYDRVEAALAEVGAEFFFTGVRMQPGKPVVFGRLPARGDASECFFFGLPGNPISTQVTFHCFVEPFIKRLSGEAAAAPRWAQATLAEDVVARPGLTRLLPARMDGVAVRTVGWQGSGDLVANARANCYAEFLPDRAYRAGEVVRVLLR